MHILRMAPVTYRVEKHNANEEVNVFKQHLHLKQTMYYHNGINYINNYHFINLHKLYSFISSFVADIIYIYNILSKLLSRRKLNFMYRNK